MRPRVLHVTLAAILAVSAGAAIARNTLIAPGAAVAVGKSGLTIRPARDWNRMGARPGRRSETWTIDGPALNDLTFYGGIQGGRTLFREVDRKNRPLPRFSATMLPTDIPQLVENSYRIALSTSLMEVTSVAPATLVGRPGVRFTYEFTHGDQVRRRGEAVGAIVAGRLYLVTFEAPGIFYFDRDIADVRALMAGATLAPGS